MGNDQTGASESPLDRALRIRDQVEQTIAALGEHPECELKIEWRRNNPYHKAEFIRQWHCTTQNQNGGPGQVQRLVRSLGA
jgi:hypothetical protein